VIVGSDVRLDFSPIWDFPMRAASAVVLALWLISLFSQPAFAEKRVALVIGNSAYRNVARLNNPVNDAAAVAGMFKKAGFDSVDSRLDLNVVEMRRALREFGNKTRDSDVAVIYYTVRLVILDACRDNPFTRTMKRTIGSRAIGRGLARVEPSSPNTMIAFSAKAGSTASDGDSRNSPFATSLVEHLAKPGLDLRKAFGFVRDDVLKATNNTQEPFVYGSLGGNDVTLVPAAPAAAAASVDQDATMRRDYELALQIGTKAPTDCPCQTSFDSCPALASEKLNTERGRGNADGKISGPSRSGKSQVLARLRLPANLDAGTSQPPR
jgi:Caspase domain